MELRLGPWFRLCLVCHNLLLVACDQAPYVESSRGADTLLRSGQRHDDSLGTENSPARISLDIRPISKRRVVSRKGVTQSNSSSPIESETDQIFNSSALQNHSIATGMETWNKSLSIQSLNISSDQIKGFTPIVQSNNNVLAELPRNTTNNTSIAEESTFKTSSSSYGTNESSVNSHTDSVAIPSTTISTVVSRKKSKPGVTFDVDDLPRDKSGNIIVSNAAVVSSEPSVDFVVPVVLALLALPFVAVIGAFLFKKSRDFWERRHYRRMDFLIEGMYNE